MLVQMVIERLSGLSLHDFLQRRIFTPLGMRATYLRLSHDTTPNVAGEYSSFALAPWERAAYWDYTWFGAAGALVSDVADLEKWNAALDGGRILSLRSQGEMFAAGPAASSEGGAGYGMGIRVGRMPNGHRFIWHGGNTVGSATQDARFPDDNLAIIVLSNAPYYNYNAAVEAIYNVVVPQGSAAHGASPAAASSPKADPARVRAAELWLDDAVAGKIDMSAVNADVRDLLTPGHRTALRALSQYGTRTYTIAGIDRRRPTTTYAFVVQTKRKKFNYLYKWDDSGKIADILILPDVVFPREAIPKPSPAPVPAEP